MTTMKAASYERYGAPAVVRLVDVPRPVPKPNELLIRVSATTVNSGDARMRRADFGSPILTIFGRLFLGIFRPRTRVLGTAFAGVVESIGDEVDRFKVGDRVFGSAGMGMGAHSEYIALKQDATVIATPEQLNDEHASAIPFGGFTALYFLRDLTQIEPGQRVLVVGASGCVGISGVQYAKSVGAHVTGVCSGKNAELVRSLGADEVIDYTNADFTKQAQRYDVIFDTVGGVSFGACKGVLNDGGKYLATEMSTAIICQLLTTRTFGWFLGKKRVFGGVAMDKPEYLRVLKGLTESGAMAAVVDRVYGFDEIQAAHARVDTGRKAGSVVVRICHKNSITPTVFFGANSIIET
mgnify:CR=1 FL=1|tara:strand:+ start:20478 stop:21533 length:1056 start_codon:yes stop_codon:yes gene_type:complete